MRPKKHNMCGMCIFNHFGNMFRPLLGHLWITISGPNLQQILQTSSHNHADGGFRTRPRAVRGPFLEHLWSTCVLERFWSTSV